MLVICSARIRIQWCVFVLKYIEYSMIFKFLVHCLVIRQCVFFMCFAILSSHHHRQHRHTRSICTYFVCARVLAIAFKCKKIR